VVTAAPNRATNSRRVSLLSGSIVSGAMGGFELRKTGSLHQPDLHASEFPIAFSVLGMVAQHVLIAEFQPDFGCDVGQIPEIIGGEISPPRLFRNLVQQAGSVGLLRCALAPCEGLEDPDGVDLHVRLPHCVLDLALGVSAGIVASIRDDENGPARVS